MRLSCGCDFENTYNINYALILRTDGGWRPQIQDTADPYYKKPKDLLEGCGCKKNCSLGTIQVLHQQVFFNSGPPPPHVSAKAVQV